jgi:hypothetical protein
MTPDLSPDIWSDLESPPRGTRELAPVNRYWDKLAVGKQGVILRVRSRVKGDRRGSGYIRGSKSDSMGVPLNRILLFN